MPYHNTATIMGNLGQRPTLREFGDNGKVASFTLACETRHKTDGKWGPVTTWYKVTVFGKQASWIAEAPKGGTVIVTGQVFEDPWVTKEGEKRKTLSIAAETAQWVKPNGARADPESADYSGEPPF